MLMDGVQVEVLEPCRLRLRFADGLTGEVDVARIVRFEGVFEALQSPGTFATVRVDRELGTIVRPNGADLDAAVLRAAIEGPTKHGSAG
jgi:hypothetical protein